MFSSTKFGSLVTHFAEKPKVEIYIQSPEITKLKKILLRAVGKQEVMVAAAIVDMHGDWCATKSLQNTDFCLFASIARKTGQIYISSMISKIYNRLVIN